MDVILRPNNQTGELEALVEFENADQVRAAVSKGPKSLGGTDVTLVRCRPSQEVWNFQAREEGFKIYVSNLSLSVDKKMLRETFSKVSATYYDA